MIKINNLCKSFNNSHVLRGINLDIQEKSSHVIIGPSGCGKSVLLKCVLGLIQADKGKIYIANEDISAGALGNRQIMHSLSMMFQGSALFDSLSIWENIAFFLVEHGMDKKAAKKKALEKLSQVGLESRIANLFPNEISGGMQRRVALARAIIADPKIIFFDEPTTGLDPIMTSVIYDLLRNCVKEIGATAITITHDMAGAHKIADQISMMYQGQIVWEGTPDDMHNTTNPYITQFLSGEVSGPIQIVQ